MCAAPQCVLFVNCRYSLKCKSLVLCVSSSISFRVLWTQLSRSCNIDNEEEVFKRM